LILRIYVAGPYRPKTEDVHEAVRLAAHNTNKAISVGLELMKRGHIVYIPHLSHFIHTHPECDREYGWYAFDNSFINYWAEALYYISASYGADNERKLAERLKLKIFTSMDQVPVEQVEWNKK